MKNYVIGKNGEKYKVYYFQSASSIAMSSVTEVKIILPPNTHLRVFNDNWMESIVIEQKDDCSIISIRGTQAENALYNALRWVESQTGVFSDENWEEVTEEEKKRYFGDQLEKVLLVTWKN